MVEHNKLSYFDSKGSLENNYKRIFYLFFFIKSNAFSGLLWVKRPIPHRLVYSFEKILWQLMELVGYTIVCFTDCGFVCPSFLQRWDVYNRQTHVCSFSTSDVSKVLRNFPHVQNNRTHYHYDRWNGKIVWL